MNSINEDVVKKLKSFCDLHAFGPGALLYNPNTAGRQEQIRFLSSILHKTNPTTVLETGTESGLFCYFVKTQLADVKVVTFGLAVCDDRSKLCTSYLNEAFGDYIVFIEGDSKITLSNFVPVSKIDFAWIDGGHDTQTLASDLENCARLNIPHICVDDYRMIHDIVQPGIQTFLTKYPQYSLDSISNTCDDRGIAYLKLNKNES